MGAAVGALVTALAVVMASAASQPAGDGLRVAIEVEQLSDLGLPGLGHLQRLGPVRGSARLNVHEGRLRLDDLAATGGADGGTFTLRGSIADAAQWRGLDLTFELDAPAAGVLLGAPASGERLPLQASARVTGDGNDLRLSDLVVTSADSRLSGNLRIASRGARSKISGTLAVEVLDVDALVPPPPNSGSGAGTPPRLFSSQPLPLGAFTAADTDISFTATRLTLRGFTLTDARATLKGDATAATLSLTGTHAGGTLDGTLSVRPRGPSWDTALALKMDRVSWEEATRQAGIQDYIDGGPTDAEIDVRGRGQSLREIMATLDGTLRMRTGQSRIFNTVLDDAGVNLLNRLVEVFTPKEDREAVTDVECMALHAEIRDGVATTENGLAVLTRKVAMTGSGQADLGNETLSLAVRLQAREGWSFSSSSLAGGALVTGPLSAPRTQVDTTAVALSTASVLGAVVTGGLSVAAQQFLTLAGSAKRPCEAAVAGASESAAKDSTPPGPGGVITDGVGEGLRGLFGR